MWPIRRRSKTNAAARALATGAAALALLCINVPARAQSAYCNDLRARIARAGANSGAARYRAAAARQQGEINRTAVYARSLGCDRQQFLFFGDPPPPQCRQINARLGQMRANLIALERSGADDGRQELIARYDAECRDPHIITRRAPRARNLFEELFGVAPPDEGGLRQVPVDPDGGGFPPPDYMHNDETDQEDQRPRGGSMAICVRACDGGFFPVSYSARRADLDDLDDLCKALCPNAEAALYTHSPWRDLNEAVSIDGKRYAELPNALKFQKSHDASCTCKPPDKSWAEALEDAERILAASHSKDVVVSAEEAEQMSRPIAPGEARGKGRQKNPPPEAATQSGAPSETADKGAAPAPDVFRDVVGPDGVKRRVRVVAPTL
jgi:hypothetical protein